MKAEVRTTSFRLPYTLFFLFLSGTTLWLFFSYGFLGFVLATVLIAEGVNGWTDAPNAIATVVSTKVLSPLTAVFVAAFFNIAGAMSGTAVATTIGSGIVDTEVVHIGSILAVMVSVILWGSIAGGVFGIPVSKSHALVASLAGAGLAAGGVDALLWSGWQKVLIGIGLAIVFGFVFSFILAAIIRICFANTNPVKSKKLFNTLQIFSAGAMAFAHGSNDGQKFIGIFALTLVLGGISSSFTIPFWVILVCSVVMGVGTLLGGWRIIKTVGVKMGGFESWQGFSAEAGAAGLIYGASYMGIPLSTTHTIDTAIMGAMSASSTRTIRWNIVRDIGVAWIITFPVCLGLAFVISLLLR